MPYSYAVYTGNGATTQFTVPFPYIRREHVVVSVDYVSTAFTWVSNSTVQVSPAPANATRVEVRRVTPVNNPLVDFTDGSTLVAADLDTNALQQTYINQEQDDQIQQGIYVDANGNLTAGNQVLKDLLDPVAPQDAATKNYVDTNDAQKVNKAGDTMTGPLAMSGQKITGLGDPTNAQDATTKSWVETAATSPLQQFRSIFYGAFATDQATDPYGNPPTEGDLYFNSTLDQMRVFNGTSWQEASADATITRFKFTAAGGETSLSGADDNAEVLTYNVGLEMVYLNGALLTRGVDYVATNGSSITGLVALSAADLVEVVAFSQINAVGSIPGANIADGTITTAKLADSSVTTGKLNDLSVTTAKLADSSVTSSKIADGTIVDADVNASAGIVASKLSFTQTGTGATARTVDSKLKDVVSVKDFGAVGDEVADDTLAIQTAIDAIPSTGGTLYFPGGRYKVTSTLTVANKCVSLEGVGSGQAGSSTSGSFIVFHGLGAADGIVFDNTDGHYVSNIAFAADLSTRPTGGHLVVYQGTSAGWYHVTWQNVLVVNGFNGTWFKNGFFYHAYSCIWKGFNGNQAILGNGVSDANDAQVLTFVNCNIAAETSTTTDLVVLDGFAASTKFHGCSLLFGRIGLWLKNSYGSATPPGFTYFSGGGFENCASDSIRLDAGNHFMLSNAYVSSDGKLAKLLKVASTFGGEITVAGCYLRGGGGGGVWLEDGNAVITGNTIVNNNAVSPDTYNVSGAVAASGKIRVTTSSNHDFETDDIVAIAGVTGTTEANGHWIITKVSSTQFDLTTNAESDTGAASVFANAYVSGGTAVLASASIRILPTASYVTICGNNLGGASSGLRTTEYGVHNAGTYTTVTNNTVQSVVRSPYQSIVNTRTAGARYNLGVTSDANTFDPYQVDGALTYSNTGTVIAGTYNFGSALYVTGAKIRVVRVTRVLSSGAGNSVTARILVDGANVGSTTQDGTTVTDTVLATPIVIDGTGTPQRVQIQLLSLTGTPTDFAYQAQFQIIT